MTLEARGMESERQEQEWRQQQDRGARKSAPACGGVKREWTPCVRHLAPYGYCASERSRWENTLDEALFVEWDGDEDEDDDRPLPEPEDEEDEWYGFASGQTNYDLKLKARARAHRTRAHSRGSYCTIPPLVLPIVRQVHGLRAWGALPRAVTHALRVPGARRGV